MNVARIALALSILSGRNSDPSSTDLSVLGIVRTEAGPASNEVKAMAEHIIFNHITAIGLRVAKLEVLLQSKYLEMPLE